MSPWTNHTHMWLIMLSWVLGDHTPNFGLIGFQFTFSPHPKLLHVGVAMAKPHPLQAHVFLMLTRVLGEHKLSSEFCVQVFGCDAYTHTQTKINIKVCSWILLHMSQRYSEILFFLSLFLFTHQWEEVQPEGIWYMLLSKSSCVCKPCFKSVAPKVCLAKIQFVAIFWPNMNINMGVVIYMYLKHSPDIIVQKYIWILGLTQ